MRFIEEVSLIKTKEKTKNCVNLFLQFFVVYNLFPSVYFFLNHFLLCTKIFLKTINSFIKTFLIVFHNISLETSVFCIPKLKKKTK